ncbi:hypothetical protein [Thiorhodospira sibirica]|uniref:hypothetical protein n=1 Tax=Thiorhodospira sibirica TaxID=154347 RepID=UPI00022C462B|nr:hypothetical protein [Thiorhodospira sibirica]
MKSKTHVLRLGTVAIVAMSASSISCAAPEVYQQGNSTAVIDQRGGGSSTTQVIRTPEGQQVISRDGKSSSVTIQQSGPAGSSHSTTSTGNAVTPIDAQQRLEQRTSQARTPVEAQTDAVRTRADQTTAEEAKERAFWRIFR